MYANTFSRTGNIERVYVLIIKTKNRIIAKKYVKDDYHIILKIFLIILCVFLTRASTFNVVISDQSPDWQVQNSIIYASKKQICSLRSHIFLYSCSSLKSIYKNKSSFNNLILLLCGDIERNPGPDNWYSLRQPKMGKDSVLQEIHSLGVNLHADERNSTFRYYEYIQENSADWQSHLQRISDFLIFENRWWKKTDFGIEFFDFVNQPKDRDQHPNVHHFRSSDISSITHELEGQ